MTRHFGVDLGAESGRCIVGTLEDGRLTLEELCRFPTQGLRVLGERRWNVYRFYEEIIKGLGQYVSRFGTQLDSIGVDTWGVDYGLLDRQGKLLELPYSYRDSRVKNSHQLLGDQSDAIYHATGVQFMEINTLNQLLVSQQAQDTALENAHKLLFIGDLLHYMLGAPPVCEYTAASVSQLVDTRKKQWDGDIFTHYNLPQRIQSEIVFAGDCIGQVSPQILEEVGLRGPVKIIAPAVHDTASAIAAVPAQPGHWGYISSGTWSLLGVELDQVVTSPQSLAMNISNSGGVLGKNLFLKNVMGLWIIQQCKRQWSRSDPTLDYPKIVELAAAACSFGGMIDPDAPVFFSPDNMPQEICRFLADTGQPVPHPQDVGAIARIVYESLSLKYRYVMERIAQCAHTSVEALYIIGGGSQNSLLNQMTANALDIPVHAGPGEATVMGNILLQAYGCGQLHSLAELRAVVQNSVQPAVFYPQQREQWQQAYRDFCQLLSHG